ncbi:GNAT family N-acetyltransferase [Kitasatospora sp. NBC_01560]|uniref:GNAT family N-acetyltransferase n=1 Tax=Kitasatospora sp. NBC_01560 TaxID=2975965 RepID=UPI00386F107F
MPPVTAAMLRTDRLDLVPLGPGHADEMAAVLADPALHAFTGGAPDTADALRARYARLAAGSPDPAVAWGNWALRLRADGRLAGYVQATVGPDTAELAWVVGTPWQGRGLAAEAARAVLGHLRAAGTTTVLAHIHPDHPASAAVARSLGLAPTDERQDGEVRWRLVLTEQPEPPERS